MIDNKTLRNTLLIILMLGAAVLWAQSGFDLEAFSDSTKYGWQDYLDRAEYRQDLIARQNMLQLYELEALSVRDNFLKSAVVPGWGQFATKHNTKATVILSVELVAVMGSIYFYDQAMTNHQLYQSATQIDEINHYYGKAQTPYQFSLMMLGLGTIVWGYNLYDVIISTNEYNSDLWQDIMKRRRTSPLQVTPAGLELRF
jgi:hypothetical protein